MTANQPLISVVIITYNSAPYILEALESIKHQTYTNIELIISDDASTDETVTVCKEWLSQNSSFFINTQIITTEVNTGTALNFNRGIKAAQGEWIKIIAGDDAFYPDVLEKYIQYVNSNPDVEFIHSQAVPFDEKLEEGYQLPLTKAKNYRINRSGISSKEQSEILLRICLIGAPTVMIKSDVFKKVGYYSEEYPLWEDRPMWYKLTKSGIKLHFLDIKGAKYRLRKNSIANNKQSKTLISPFAVYKSRALLDTFIKELPWPEKILKIVAYKWYIKFSEYEGKSLVAKKFYFISVLPLMTLVHRIDQRYR